MEFAINVWTAPIGTTALVALRGRLFCTIQNIASSPFTSLSLSLSLSLYQSRIRRHSSPDPCLRGMRRRLLAFFSCVAACPFIYHSACYMDAILSYWSWPYCLCYSDSGEVDASSVIELAKCVEVSWEYYSHYLITSPHFWTVKSIAAEHHHSFQTLDNRTDNLLCSLWPIMFFCRNS
jgi:hypothetical protein